MYIWLCMSVVQTHTFLIDWLHYSKFWTFMQPLCMYFLFKISTLKIWCTFDYSEDMAGPIKSCFSHPWISIQLLLGAEMILYTSFSESKASTSLQNICTTILICFWNYTSLKILILHVLCLHRHTYTHAYTHTCMHAYTHTYMHACMHTHTCIHTYTYIHIHYTYIHTHVHIHEELSNTAQLHMTNKFRW